MDLHYHNQYLNKEIVLWFSEDHHIVSSGAPAVEFIRSKDPSGNPIMINMGIQWQTRPTNKETPRQYSKGSYLYPCQGISLWKKENLQDFATRKSESWTIDNGVNWEQAVALFIGQAGHSGNRNEINYGCNYWRASDSKVWYVNDSDEFDLDSRFILFYQDPVPDVNSTGYGSLPTSTVSVAGTQYTNDSSTRYDGTEDEIGYSLQPNVDYMARFSDLYPDYPVAPNGIMYGNQQTLYFTLSDDKGTVDFQNATFEIRGGAFSANTQTENYSIDDPLDNWQNMPLIKTIPGTDINNLTWTRSNASSRGVKVSVNGPSLFNGDVDTFMSNAGYSPTHEWTINGTTLRSYHCFLVVRESGDSSGSFYFRRLFIHNLTYNQWIPYHSRIRSQRRRHRLLRSANRTADRTHQAPHRTPARQPQGLPLAPRPDRHDRTAPQAVGLPEAHRIQSLHRNHCQAQAAEHLS